MLILGNLLLLLHLNALAKRLVVIGVCKSLGWVGRLLLLTMRLDSFSLVLLVGARFLTEALFFLLGLLVCLDTRLESFFLLHSTGCWRLRATVVKALG